MVRTPLRLIASDEGVEDTTPEGAAPVDVVTDGAVTRRVSDAEMGTVRKTASERTAGVSTEAQGPQRSSTAARSSTMAGELRGSPTRRGRAPLVVGGVVAGAVIVGALVLGLKPAPATKASVAPGAPVAPSSAQVPVIARATPPGAQDRAEIRADAEFVHLEITVEQIDADVSLDGNVVAGRRLNLRVPKDRAVHVIGASAPGYVPFTQQVSFSSDVALSISLRRIHREAARPAAPVKARPARPEVPAKVEAPSKAPRPGHHVEPGMSLDDNAGPRLGGKDLDERNPYRP